MSALVFLIGLAQQPETESFVINLLIWIGGLTIAPLAAACVFLFRYIIKLHRSELVSRESMKIELLEVIRANTQSNIFLKAAIDANTKATDQLPETIMLLFKNR